MHETASNANPPPVDVVMLALSLCVRRFDSGPAHVYSRQPSVIMLQIYHREQTVRERREERKEKRREKKKKA